ncbi:uncharacterized protein N7459_002549 [Penicillium hispanicum]|uniref:uncharacterized protein n=1 Tax=Penicillium hispanicum TaxID=1080232 RepID=UPI002541C363|nr:uncharacterized protein N7459_002549 [Penicillium hispanicum]KAJ5586784.1 hypothetical protein N7459_002549 [Penicillium hispanicum]
MESFLLQLCPGSMLAQPRDLLKGSFPLQAYPAQETEIPRAGRMVFVGAHEGANDEPGRSRGGAAKDGDRPHPNACMGDDALGVKEGRNLVIVVVVLGCISVLSTVLRVVSRRMSLGLDDYCMVTAMCLVIASTVVVILTVTKGGVGLPTKKVSSAGTEFVLKMLIPCQALYGAGLALVKTSMMILYYKLFGKKTSTRIAIYTTGAIVWAWALSVVLESFLICQPIAYNWNPSLPGGRCRNRNVAYVVAGVLNMVTDFMVMALPISYIWSLQMPIGRKLGLVAAFSLGLFVSAISMVRVVSLLRINFDNVTYTLPMPLMWSIVEEQLAIVAGNLPHLRCIFSDVLPAAWLGSSDQSEWSIDQFGVRKSSLYNVGLTRMDIGINRSVVTTGKPNMHTLAIPATRWSDDRLDGQSDSELASNGVPPDGIHMRKEFRVE